LWVARDWYRSSSWAPEDREQFEARLSKARMRSRAQYLRIQGLVLSELPDKDARAAGGGLLERVLLEHQDDELQVAMTHTALAHWHRRERRDTEAVRHFREAVAREDIIRSLDTGAGLDLAELIVAVGDDGAFAEVRRLLHRAEERSLAFKSLRWRWLVTSARVAALSGDRASAAEHARVALELLHVEAPDFSRHPTLGHIVTDADTVELLRRLAGRPAS
jgi:hypothetical protein